MIKWFPISIIIFSIAFPFSSFPATDADLKRAINSTQIWLDQLIENQKTLKINLEKKSQGFRPKSCPLHSTDDTALSKKLGDILNGLENNKNCSQKVVGTINTINNSINELSKLESDEMEWKRKERDHLKLMDPNSQVDTVSIVREKWASDQKSKKIGILNGSLNNFATIAANTECQKTMSTNQGISTLSEVIFGMSGFGLLYPQPSGIEIASGGMVVGSLLKLISILMKPKWNFSHQEDRTAFIQLNCSFFDLKTDIKKAGLLSSKTREEASELVTLKSHMKDIDEKISILTKLSVDRNATQKVVTAAKIIGVFGEGGKFDGELSTKVYYALKDFRLYIQGFANIQTNSNDRIKAIVNIFNKHRELVSLIEANSSKINVGISEKGLLPQGILNFKKIFPKNSTKDSIEKNNVIQNYLKTSQLKGTPNQHKKTELDTQYHNFLTKLLVPLEFLESHLESLANRKILSNILLDTQFQARILIAKLDRYKNSFLGRNIFLSNLDRGAIFSEVDNGSSIKAEILLKFKEIEEGIYGPLGESFLSYVADKAEEYYKEFTTLYSGMKEKISFNKIALSDCPDLLQIRTAYHTSQALTNIGFDFLMANKDSFYNPTSNWSWLRKSKAWSQTKIKEHYESTINALKIINKYQGNIPDMAKNPIKKITYTPVGSLMFKLSQDHTKLVIIENSVNRIRCDKLDTTQQLPSWANLDNF